MPLDIYVFPSESRENIRIGVEQRIWAIPEPGRSRVIRQFTTKAQDMPVGAHGIFYCSAGKAFMDPFIVASEPEPSEVVDDVWDGKFILPFRIHPLGNGWQCIGNDVIEGVLPSLRNSGERWYKKMRFRPNQVFLPSSLSVPDWQALIQHLATISA